jgi:hypothetical protein
MQTATTTHDEQSRPLGSVPWRLSSGTMAAGRNFEAARSSMRFSTTWRPKRTRRKAQDAQISVEGAGTLGVVVGDERSVLNHIPSARQPSAHGQRWARPRR